MTPAAESDKITVFQLENRKAPELSIQKGADPLRQTAKICAVLAVLTLLLTSCLLPEGQTPSRAASDRVVFAMDTQMSLRLYGDDGTGMKALEELLQLLDGELSATAEGSDLSVLNRDGSSDNAHIRALTEGAIALSERTGGALDVSLRPASLLWGFTTDQYRVPEPAEIEALRERVGMDGISLTETGVSLREGLSLDFGALAKGCAADFCRERMEEAGLCGILDLGGNIQTVGDKPDGSEWNVGIQDPDDPGAFLVVLRFSGSKAVVTSGDYQRYFEQDGVRYCHILDPETLSPVRGSLRSVTVVAKQGLLADGLATALFVLGREKAADLWRNSDDFEAIFLESDGTVWITAGLEGMVSGTACQVISR